MCPTYREVRLIQSNLSDLSDKFNMALDTNPTKPTKCVYIYICITGFIYIQYTYSIGLIYL